jgi:hypothetical protein
LPQNHKEIELKILQSWRHQKWQEQLKLRLQVLPVRMVEELEVDDDGGQEVQHGEVRQKVADQLLVRSLKRFEKQILLKLSLTNCTF